MLCENAVAIFLDLEEGIFGHRQPPLSAILALSVDHPP
jgi:hypothetical protein